jgi:hypothetical protein
LQARCLSPGGNDRLALQEKYEQKLSELQSPEQELLANPRGLTLDVGPEKARAVTKAVAAIQIYELTPKIAAPHRQHGENMWALCRLYSLGVVLLSRPVFNLGHVGKCSKKDMAQLLSVLGGMSCFAAFMSAVSAAAKVRILGHSARPEAAEKTRTLGSFILPLDVDAMRATIQGHLTQAPHEDNDEAESVD